MAKLGFVIVDHVHDFRVKHGPDPQFSCFQSTHSLTLPHHMPHGQSRRPSPWWRPNCGLGPQVPFSFLCNLNFVDKHLVIEIILVFLTQTLKV